MTGRLNLGARAGAAALLSLVLLLLALAATPALGQEEVPAAPPELLMIDATDEPFVVLRTATEPSQVTITLGGVPWLGWTLLGAGGIAAYIARP